MSPYGKNNDASNKFNHNNKNNRSNNKKKSQIPCSKPIISKKSSSNSPLTNNYNNSRKTLRRINSSYKHKNKVLLEELDKIVNEIFPLSNVNTNINKDNDVMDDMTQDQGNNKAVQQNCFQVGNGDEDIIINRLSKFNIN